MEWSGGQPQRFKSNRAHVKQEIKEPLEHTRGKVHFEAIESMPKPYKPHVKMIDYKPQQNSRPGGIKKIVENFTLPKPRAERLHLKTKDSSIKKVKAEGIKAYPEMHALSTKSYEHTDTMGKKQPVDGLLNQRNNIPLTSMGDKAYKYPEYSKDFYKEGGLMVGSSNVMTYKTSGIVMDFYSNVKLKDGVPNTAVKWKDKVKKETQDHDQKLVASLYDWERAVLKEADPNFRDPDYSSGDEAPVKEAKPAQPQGKPAARPGRK